jgi:hypothetical protein
MPNFDRETMTQWRIERRLAQLSHRPVTGERNLRRAVNQAVKVMSPAALIRFLLAHGHTEDDVRRIIAGKDT